MIHLPPAVPVIRQVPLPLADRVAVRSLADEILRRAEPTVDRRGGLPLYMVRERGKCVLVMVCGTKLDNDDDNDLGDGPAAQAPLPVVPPEARAAAGLPPNGGKRGRPPSDCMARIVAALVDAGRPMRAAEIVSALSGTGHEYGDTTVRANLDRLVEVGVIVKTSAGYCLPESD